MKNILKKIGVFGLTIAVLAPFIELPKVNAATDSNCTTHLQNYMFLDSNYFVLKEGKTFLEGYSSNGNSGGYLTYTVFPYVFSNTNGNNITINWIDTNNFGGGTGSISELDNYWKLAKEEDSTDKIYVEVESSSYRKNTDIGSVFITESNHKNGTYADTSVIFHGVWSSFDKDGKPTNERDNNVKYEYGKDYSIQTIFNKKQKLNLLSSNIGTALLTTTSSGFKFGSSAYSNLTANYFQDAVDGNWEKISASSSYIPLSINRTINYGSNVDDVLNGFIYGFVEKTGKVIVFTDTQKHSKLSEVNDSYTALKAWLEAGESSEDRYTKYTINSEQDSDIKESSLDFNIGKAYYWPTVLTVEYQTCSVTGEWSVTYDDNVDDTSVTNLPASQTETLGKNIVVSSGKPSRTGYTFKKWCETTNGSGKCYNPGEEVTSPTEEKTVTLYAQWGKSGAEKNEKTGVVSYIIGFAAVGVVAGGIYLISKKKNLFKQI